MISTLLNISSDPKSGIMTLRSDADAKYVFSTSFSPDLHDLGDIKGVQPSQASPMVDSGKIFGTLLVMFKTKAKVESCLFLLEG